VTIRVLVADDHPAFVAGLCHLLEAVPDVVVAGAAPDGDAAVSAALDLDPDVVIMDLQMPGRNGIEATRQILAARPHVAVLVLTMLEDDDSVFAAMRAGARGYLLKGAGLEEISAAVSSVARGDVIFGGAVAQRMLAYFGSPRERPPDPFPQLTAREREVLDLLADGVDNTTIARRLAMSPKTVRNHVSSIFAKLQVADRTQAALRARSEGMGRGVSQPDGRR
jgi:DNA-binding NarL/FixJ family response regulator